MVKINVKINNEQRLKKSCYLQLSWGFQDGLIVF